MCILAESLTSCSDNEEIVTNSSQIGTDKVNKDAVWAFSSKEDIMQAVNGDEPFTRVATLNPGVGTTITSTKFLSLTDKVQANDPVLNEV